MKTVQIADMIAQVRRLSDTVGSDYVDDATIVAYMNSEYGHLYATLVDAFGASYFAKRDCLFPSGRYANLPEDTYKVVMIGECDCITGEFLACPDDASIKKLASYSYDDQWVGADETHTPAYAGYSKYRYQLKADKVVFSPMPPSGQGFCIEYVPSYTDLALGGSFDAVNGYDDYLILGAAARIVMSERVDDTNLLRRQQGDVLADILKHAPNEDPLRVKQVRDIEPHMWRDEWR